MGELKGVSIESDNFLLMLGIGFVIWRITIWKRGNHLDEFTGSVVNCWLIAFSAEGFKGGWFAISRHTAPVGKTWNPAMYEWRWLVIMVATLAMLYGTVRFVKLIDGFSDKMMYGMMGFFYIISRLMGFY